MLSPEIKAGKVVSEQAVKCVVERARLETGPRLRSSKEDERTADGTRVTARSLAAGAFLDLCFCQMWV